MKSNLSPHLSHPGIFTYKVTKAGHTLTHSAPISSSTTVVNISPPRTPVDGATGLVFSVHGLSRGKTAQLEVEFMGNSALNIMWPPPSSASFDIFQFNHIDAGLPRETVEMLKHFYAFYHKLHCGYARLARSFKRKHLICTVVETKAIVSRAVAGGITLNPFVLAALTCFGLAVKAVVAVKKYNKKFERVEFARLEYKKLRNLRRARAAQLGAGA